MTAECSFKAVNHEFDCGLCDFKCTVPNNFLTHCKHNHGDILPLSCKMCKSLYFKARNLVSHIEICHHKLLFSCGNNDCSFVSPDRFAFEWHLITCNKNGFICIYCKSRFTTTENLFSHLKLSFNEQDSEDPPKTCRRPRNKKPKRESKSQNRKNGSLKNARSKSNFSKESIPVLPPVETSHPVTSQSTPVLNQNCPSSQATLNNFICENEEAVQIHLPEPSTYPATYCDGLLDDMQNIIDLKDTVNTCIATDSVKDNVQFPFSLGERNDCSVISGNSDILPPKVYNVSLVGDVPKNDTNINSRNSVSQNYDFCIEKAGLTEFKVKSQNNCFSSFTEREQCQETTFSLGEIEKLAEGEVSLVHKDPPTELLIKTEPIDEEFAEMYENFSTSLVIPSSINATEELVFASNRGGQIFSSSGQTVGKSSELEMLSRSPTDSLSSHTTEEHVITQIKKEAYNISDQTVVGEVSRNLKNAALHDHLEEMKISYLNQGKLPPADQSSNLICKLDSISEDSSLSNSAEISISGTYSESLKELKTESENSFSDRICLRETGVLKLEGHVSNTQYIGDSSNDSYSHLIIDEDMSSLQANKNIKGRNPNESETEEFQLSTLISKSSVEIMSSNTEEKSSTFNNVPKEYLGPLEDNSDDKIINFGTQLLSAENISSSSNSSSASQFEENIPNKIVDTLQPISDSETQASTDILPISLQNSPRKRVSFISKSEIELCDSESTESSGSDDADLNSPSCLNFTSKIDTDTLNFPSDTFRTHQTNTWQKKNSADYSDVCKSNTTVRQLLKKFRYKNQISKLKRYVYKGTYTRSSCKVMKDKSDISEGNLNQEKITSQFEHDIPKLKFEQKQENCAEMNQLSLEESSSHTQNKTNETANNEQIISFTKKPDQNRDKASDKISLKECIFLPQNHAVQSKDSCKMFTNNQEILDKNKNITLSQTPGKMPSHEPYRHGVNLEKIEKLQNASKNSKTCFISSLNPVSPNSPVTIQPKFIPLPSSLLRHLPSLINKSTVINNPKPIKFTPILSSNIQTVRFVPPASKVSVVMLPKSNSIPSMFIRLSDPNKFIPMNLSRVLSTTPTPVLSCSNIRIPNPGASCTQTKNNISKNIFLYAKSKDSGSNKDKVSRPNKGKVSRTTSSTPPILKKDMLTQRTEGKTVVYPKTTIANHSIDSTPADLNTVSRFPKNPPSETNKLKQELVPDNKELPNVYIEVIDSNDLPIMGSNVQYLKYLKQQKSSSLLKTMSKNTDFFKCMFPSCPYTSNSTSEFKEHSQLHGDENVQCMYCLKIFSNSISLVEHSISDHRRRIFQCSVCFYRACSRMHVFAHLQACHKTQGMVMTGTPISVKSVAPMMDNVKMYVNIKNICCPVFTCKFSTNSITDMAYHMWKHSSLSGFPCFQCDFMCSSSLKWISHLKLHDIFLLQCFYCSFGCNKRLHMLNHLAINHADYPLMTYVRTSKHLLFNLECYLMNVNENDIQNCPTPSYCYCFLFLYHAGGDQNGMLKLLENIKTKSMHFKMLECLYCFRKYGDTTKMEKHLKTEHCPSTLLQYYPCISQTLSNAEIRTLFVTNERENTVFTNEFKTYLLYLKELKTGVMQEHFLSGKFEIKSVGMCSILRMLLLPPKVNLFLGLPQRIILSFHNAFKIKWRAFHYSCDYCKRQAKTLYELRMHWKNTHVQNGKRFAYHILHGLKNRSNHELSYNSLKVNFGVHAHSRQHRMQLGTSSFNSIPSVMDVNVSNCNDSKNFQHFSSRKRKSQILSSPYDGRVFKKKCLRVEQPYTADNIPYESNATSSSKCLFTQCNSNISTSSTCSEPCGNNNNHHTPESDTKSGCEMLDLKMSVFVENYACPVKIPVRYLQNVVNLQPSLHLSDAKETLLNDLKKYYKTPL